MFLVTFATVAGTSAKDSVPGVLLAAILGVGLALGVLASLLPAYRSTRLAVLDALRAT